MKGGEGRGRPRVVQRMRQRGEDGGRRGKRAAGGGTEAAAEREGWREREEGCWGWYRGCGSEEDGGRRGKRADEGGTEAAAETDNEFYFLSETKLIQCSVNRQYGNTNCV